MNIKNRNLHNSFHCLLHPVTCLSIALLLINDHLLKEVSPSWFTGKLSDFSGLFFLPFILTTGLSLTPLKKTFTPRLLGFIAFSLTALCFILLKTVQSINLSATQIMSYLIGVPVHYSLDPTDLLAVLVLIPAWHLWIRPKLITSTRFAFIPLLIGTLAIAATSPREWTVYTVTNLEYYKDGIVYAADRDGWGDISYPVAKSLDGGATWESANEIENIEQRGLPIRFCSRINSDICYQVSAAGVLEELESDGTWVKVDGLVYKNAYDLIHFDWEEKEFVIVAVGEYGILRRELPNGQWTRIAVLRAGKP
jgi:hypothetical protein